MGQTIDNGIVSLLPGATYTVKLKILRLLVDDATNNDPSIVNGVHISDTDLKQFKAATRYVDQIKFARNTYMLTLVDAKALCDKAIALGLFSQP